VAIRRDKAEAEGGEARKRWLSQNLRKLMSERELKSAELARLIAKRMPGDHFNPINISHYRAGRALPRAQVLLALCEALEVGPEKLFEPPTSQLDAPNAKEKVEPHALSSQDMTSVDRRLGRVASTGQILGALCDLLSVTPEQLLASINAQAGMGGEDARPSVSADADASCSSVRQDVAARRRAPPFQIADLSGGEAWVSINQSLPWPTVIKILQALKGEGHGEPE
jgi:DNA-binding Xre family transcriptional regulator